MEAIPFTVNDAGTHLVTLKTIRRFSPGAADMLVARGAPEVDHNDTFWVILKQPLQVDEDDDTWSWTNEPELGAWLSEGWNDYAVPVGDDKVIFLCGGVDDEYGWFWSQIDNEWINYSF